MSYATGTALATAEESFFDNLEVSMHMLRSRILVPAILTLALSAPLAAQDRHAVPPASIAEAVAAQVAAQDADRAVLRDTLSRPEVLAIAQGVGLDLDRARTAIDTRSPERLPEAAASARQLNEALVGGASTITISTTTIIIVLLVVILILVAD
jgi:hypothetical protein